MKRSIMLFTVLIMVWMLRAPAASANGIEQPVRFGLGLTLGYPGIGLSTNTFVAEGMSLKADLYPFYNFHAGALDFDFLFWLHDIAKSQALDFTWFAGPGAAIVLWDSYDRYNHRYDRFQNNDTNIGAVIKGAIGLALQFNPQPFDLSFELSPGMMVSEYGASFWISAMLASRYYF